jgi:flagellar motor switch protein FliM
MKPERSFVAARALAQHCHELLRVGLSPDESLAMLEQAGHALAKALAPMLAPLLGGEAPVVCAAAPQPGGADALAAQVAPLAANSLLACGAQASSMLISIEAEAVFWLVDRAFGGKGQLRGKLPGAFPLSAELMIVRLETLVIAALGVAFGLTWPAAIRPLRRDGSLAALVPFSADAPLAIQHLTITEPSGSTWTLSLAIPLVALGELGDRTTQLAPKLQQDRAPANPAEDPYGAMPLTVRAVLVDMAMPVSVLSQLAPGQVLPVTIARNVPLRVGGTTIAHGTIGALDERVAVQITQSF